MLTSLIASLLVLAVTVVVLDEVLKWQKRIHTFVAEPPTLSG
jgi:hypothetical protein